MFNRAMIAILCLMITLSCGGKTQDQDNLATVNGKKIAGSQFEAYLKFKRLDGGDEGRRGKLLDQYLEREGLASAIESEKLLDNDLIQAELDEFRKEMLISRYFEAFLKDKVTDAAVQNYYNTHAADYEERQVHVAHILIRTNSKMSEPERKAKLTTAQEAYSKVRAGKDFGEIAGEFSEDKVSAKKGGDLGWMKEGSVDPKFSKAIFETAPGEITEPFETPFGFHVVKVLEAPRTIKRPFEAVAGDIRYQLRAKAKKAELERLNELVKIEK